MYTPKPINTSDVVLPKELEALTELIAKNCHEVWAVNRISQGWSYGKQRNDEKKQTPCLVPYEELSEKEKQYDRNTAMESIKLVLKLNYKIEKL